MIANEIHGLLRARTATLHLQTEQALAVFDLGCRAGDMAFLQATAAASIFLESWLDQAGIEAVLPDWPSRRRAPLLAADLAALEADVPTLDAARPDGDPLGVAYVLEGSRFRERVLLKTIATPPDPAVMAATRFLSQASSRERWTDPLRVLRRVALIGERRAVMVRGAAAAFNQLRDCAVRVAARGELSDRHPAEKMRMSRHGAAGHLAAVN